MDRRDSVEKALHHQIARLGQELEQAHVALEDAQAEAAALAVEQDQLRHRVRALDRARAIAEHQATIFRNQAAQASAGYPNDRGKHLQSALEEASVLAEELKASNEELMLANEQLDQRVAERTTALDRAYADCTAGSRLKRWLAPRPRRIFSSCKSSRQSASSRVVLPMILTTF